MSACPKCDTEIGAAAYCGCGWKRGAKARDTGPERRCDCCYEGCSHDAMVKIKTPTGWANMCLDHYAIYHHAKAEKHCRDLGLNTRAQRLAWLRQNWRQLTALPPIREPGQDDEELAAMDQA